MTYDTNNVFAKMLRGEIPVKKIHDDAYSIAFHDIHPRAPVHVLVIPRNAYTDINDFTARASDAEIAAVMRAVGKVARDAGIDASGYRVITNCGTDGGQEVPHLHFHVLGGRKIGRMVADQ